MTTWNEEQRIVKTIRVWTFIFIMAFVAVGVSALLLEYELDYLSSFLGVTSAENFTANNPFEQWIQQVLIGIKETNSKYPFISYGTDWLAFAHITIAIAFIGVFVRPLRNIWIIYFGMISCILVVPTALICGSIREIPLFWQLVDCSFGVLGLIPLIIILVYTKKLERITGSIRSRY